MNALAACHSRRPLPGTAERFVCLHPRVFAKGSVVSYEFCRQCELWRLPAPAEFRPAPRYTAERAFGPCRHLGQEAGLRECAGCAGHVRIKVFACRHPQHVETTLTECEQCDDFEPTPPSLPPHPHAPARGRGEGGHD